jgi:protein gp37
MMNKTGVEYADYSWNPITGCFGTNGALCGYCYAKGTARRFAVNVRDDGTTVRGKACEEGKIHELDFPICMGAYDDKGRLCGAGAQSPYPYGFDPTFHNYRFSAAAAPASVKKPSIIFVGDMADMFGSWVPDEWIQAVFEVCADTPQHKYLFLTKHPDQYDRLGYLLGAHECDDIARNFFFGFTASDQRDVDCRSGEADFYLMPYYHCFVSIEPLCAPIELDGMGRNGIEWVIVGADTSNRKNKVIPKKEWIERIVDDCKRSGVPVFIKDNLRDIWAADLIQEYPEGLRCQAN